VRCPVSVVAIVVGVLCGNSVIAAEKPRRPNVLFVSLDDMNDWAGCLGGHPDARTPNLDRLAHRGVLFTNAHCTSPICGPSRAAVLTGMRPETTGVYHNIGTYVDYAPEAVTFPEHFRANGYRVLAAGKVDHGLGKPNPRLWNEYGPNCGVLGTPFIGDELNTDTMKPTRTIDRGRLKITLPANGGLSIIDRPTMQWDSFDWAPLDVPETDFPDRRIADWGTGQLRKAHDSPFVLAVGFYKPHQPFFLPTKYFEQYDPKRVRLPPTIAGDLFDVPAPGVDLATLPWSSSTHKTVMEHNAWYDAVRAYLATISFVDGLVGRLIETLDDSAYADNTWIILWSDHGWALGEKEHWGKHTPWAESVRVPLIIVPPRSAWPKGFRPGTRCDAMVNLLDLYPTLIEACGLPMREELEGRSLVPLVRDPQTPWSEATVTTVGRSTHSVCTKNWRYIHYFDGSEELYDLKSDPQEWFNLANDPDYAAVKDRLRRHLPADKRLKQFVRWGRWKCVFQSDGTAMLFDIHATFGVAEQDDVADEHPEVVAHISDYVKANGLTQRHVCMPETRALSDHRRRE
jgi:arylsulfatase A-like enzyme